MVVHIAGLISIIVFYVVILAIGIWAARKTGFRTKNLKIDDVMLANRSIGLFVGSFTMTATWVGGGYINGTTEVVAASGGLVWCQAPIGYSISLIFGGLFFADKMRNSGFTTMLDPFHWKYGDLMNCLLYLPALCGDIFWSAAILAALGASLKVILDMNLETAIITSGAIACLYTLLGGLYSVAYTDVIQLICMFVGLVYWQRALSAKSSTVARWLSYLGALGCLVMAVPPILIGAVAASTDWNRTDYGLPEISVEDSPLILPLVMRHLCPPAVTFIGLGAVSAAVMSSTDSSVLSASSMFARNVFGVIYARIFKVKVSETAQIWVMRAAQIAITAMACVMAISVRSIYGLFILCGDFVYVALFPQLVCVMYLKGTNSYGSFVAFFLGLCVRLLSGENSLNIPAVIRYPWYDEELNIQLFPYRTLSMLVSLFTLIGVSYSVDFLFTKRFIPSSMDFYGCFQHLSRDQLNRTPASHQLPHAQSDSGSVTRRRTANPEENNKDDARNKNISTKL